MNGMPERIWHDSLHYKVNIDGSGDFDTAYIRADLYATLEAENAALKAKADKLAEVLEEWLAMQPTTLL